MCGAGKSCGISILVTIIRLYGPASCHIILSDETSAGGPYFAVIAFTASRGRSGHADTSGAPLLSLMGALLCSLAIESFFESFMSDSAELQLIIKPNATAIVKAMTLLFVFILKIFRLRKWFYVFYKKQTDTKIVKNKPATYANMAGLFDKSKFTGLL
jgi:hypothetical protein